MRAAAGSRRAAAGRAPRTGRRSVTVTAGWCRARSSCAGGPSASAGRCPPAPRPRPGRPRSEPAEQRPYRFAGQVGAHEDGVRRARGVEGQDGRRSGRRTAAGRRAHGPGAARGRPAGRRTRPYGRTRPPPAASTRTGNPGRKSAWSSRERVPGGGLSDREHAERDGEHQQQHRARPACVRRLNCQPARATGSPRPRAAAHRSRDPRHGRQQAQGEDGPRRAGRARARSPTGDLTPSVPMGVPLLERSRELGEVGGHGSRVLAAELPEGDRGDREQSEVGAGPQQGPGRRCAGFPRGFRDSGHTRRSRARARRRSRTGPPPPSPRGRSPPRAHPRATPAATSQTTGRPAAGRSRRRPSRASGPPCPAKQGGERAGERRRADGGGQREEQGLGGRLARAAIRAPGGAAGPQQPGLVGCVRCSGSRAQPSSA